MDAPELASRVIIKRLDRRPLINLLIGVSVGFGLGLAVHLLWRGLSELYDRRSRDDRLNDMLSQLTSLKAELHEVRQLLRPSETDTVEPLQNVPFFYQPPDEDDEFFDVRSDENDDDFITLSSYRGTPFSRSSFYSATSGSFPREQRIRIGLPVPKEILMEMDRLAELALNEAPRTTVDVGGDIPDQQPGGGEGEYSLGMRCYSHGLLHSSKYRRSPEFLWRFGRAIFLASESMSAGQSDFDEMQDTPLSDQEVQSDAASLPSSQQSLLSLDPNCLNDMAYSSASRRQLVQVGLRTARRALVLARCVHEKAMSRDPDNQQPGGDTGECRIDATELAQAYKWLAVYVGLASEFGGIKQKIVYGNEFKELIDHAIALNPSDAICHHLKGRWCYEVYNITWIERQFASRLFGKTPTSSLEEAEESLNRVEQLQPNFYSANSLYVAKCCISRSDYKTAGTWLLNARRLIDQGRRPPPFIDNTAVVNEIEALITKYQGYF